MVAAVALAFVCLTVAGAQAAGQRASATELHLVPTVGSLGATWDVNGAGPLAGFRVRWRPLTRPASAWSAPIELGAQARSYQIAGLPATAATYEVRVRAIVTVVRRVAAGRRHARRVRRVRRELAGMTSGAATTLSPGAPAPPPTLEPPVGGEQPKAKEQPSEGEAPKAKEKPSGKERSKEEPKVEPPAEERPAPKEERHGEEPPVEPPPKEEPPKEEPPAEEPPHKEPPPVEEPPVEPPPVEEPPSEPPPVEEPPAEEQPAGSCSLYAAPNGSDAGKGTQAAPLKTVKALLSKLKAGETGCLASGSYEGFTTRSGESHGAAGAPVTITSSDPGAPATIAGRVVTEPGADYLTFTHLDFFDEGVTTPSVTVGSAHTTWTYDDVSAPHTICFLTTQKGQYGPGEDTLIERTRVHDCGQPFTCDDAEKPCDEPPNDGYFIHGLYDLGLRTTVRNSYFYEDSSKGVLLRGSKGSVIEHNVIDDNGSGVLFGDMSPEDDVVRWNIITNSHGICGSCLDYFGVWTFGSIGAGNSVTNNDVFGNATGNIGAHKGVTVAENIEVDPEFVDAAAHDYALQPGSPATGYGPEPE